ncbi:Trafficking protein particle complex subunit 12 [Pleurotus pulmonarius]
MRLPASKFLKRFSRKVRDTEREWFIGVQAQVSFDHCHVIKPWPSPSPPPPPSSGQKTSPFDLAAGIQVPRRVTFPVHASSRPSGASIDSYNLASSSNSESFRTDTDTEGYISAATARDMEGPMDAEIPTSPPRVYVEPPVPDPFLVDDPEDPMSEEENEASSASESSQVFTTMQSEETLVKSPHPEPNKHLPSPPPPQPEEVEDQEEAPTISLPALILPTMFLPIPNTSPLTTLLNKYIPPDKRPVRDLTGEWQRSDFHTLVMTNSWRALARMARDRMVNTDPEEIALILSLWYIRLASLARLRLFNQTSAECTNLFSVLNAIEPPSTRKYVFERILPFELEVMQARLKYWTGDHMSYLDALNVLLQKCRISARGAKDDITVSMWKERGARMCLIIASQLVEMKDFAAATKLLEPLCLQEDSNTSSPALRSSIARIYLQAGYVQMAAKHFDIVDKDPMAEPALKDMNKALLASANGEWDAVSNTLKKALSEDKENFAAVNNLAVALLSEGKLKEGIEVLETAMKASPSAVVVAEPFLFNLSTLYELRSGNALDKKRELLLEVAKWSGDGLKTACLKMPTS